MLSIKNLKVKIGSKVVLKNVNLSFQKGKIYVLMGPNGSGKTTLANVLIGNPKYKILKGDISLDGKNILKLDPSERAKIGIFVSFQNPVEISGITFSTFIRQAYIQVKRKKISISEFDNMLKKECKKIKLDYNLLKRDINDGFSGGEKKKSEVLQMLVLTPKVVILDEFDSGLDANSVGAVSEAISQFKNKKRIIILITHYKRIFDFIKVDRVYIIKNGKIIKEGNPEIIES